jgi:hypothetical protein
MNTKADRFGRLIGADFFSPKDFVRHALLIVVLFVIAHAFGLREFTTIISGTMASPALGAETCTLLGIGYMALYFGAVVLAPILLIAAGLLKIAQHLARHQKHEP